jgi:hypothetical protein
MDVAPSVLSLAHLDRSSGFNGDSGKLGDLNTPLLDEASTLSVDYWWEHKGCLGAGQVKNKVINYSASRILANNVADRVGIVDIAKDLVGSLAIGATGDVGNRKDTCARDLKPVAL